MAFWNCSSLSKVYCLATYAPVLGLTPFYGIADGATLYYPSRSNYSSWDSFSNKEEISTSFTDANDIQYSLDIETLTASVSGGAFCRESNIESTLKSRTVYY